MQFDVDSIKQRLITKLRSKSSWANILFYSTNQRLIDTFSEGLAELARYDEYLTREVTWDLAQNRSSLMVQSQRLRYKPHRKIGAQGEIRVGLSDVIGSEDWIDTKSYDEDETVYYNNVIYKSLIDNNVGHQPDTSPTAWETVDIKPSVTVDIPKYTIFSNGEDLKVTSINDESLTVNDNFIDIQVIQGIPKSITLIAQGEPFEEFEIDGDSIENSEYEVYVNDVLWEEISDLRLTDSGDDTKYEIHNKLDFSGITLKFGNNIFGKKLEKGDVILFKYIETLGIDGNITARGIINKVESTIFNEHGETVDLKCYNLKQLDGGNNEEDIEDIRTLGTNVFQTGDRAVTREDWKTILLQNDFIQNATVWGEYEYNIDKGNTPGTYVELEENMVHISAFTTSGEQLNDTQKDSIRLYLLDYISPTDIPDFVDTEFIYLVFNSDIYISNRSYVLSTVKNNIINALQDEYALNNMDFKQNINESDYKAFIDGLDGVDYHNTEVEFYKFGKFDVAYTASLNFSLYSVKKRSISIYIKNNTSDTEYSLIATDNGNGGFNAESGYDVTGSTINYETGECYLNVESGLTDNYANYSIKFYWQTDDKNLILKKRNQIFRFGEANITTQYTSI